MLTIVRLNAIVQKYNLTAANYGYVIRYNMYAPTTTEHHSGTKEA